jgi:hypothetical protein
MLGRTGRTSLKDVGHDHSNEMTMLTEDEGIQMEVQVRGSVETRLKFTDEFISKIS